MINLKNKKAVITGATGGIGNSIIEKFHSEGAKVLGTGTNEDKLSKLKKNFDDMIIKKFDISKHDQIEKFVDNVCDELGGCPEILINNAGIMHPPKTLSAQGYEIQFAVNHLAHMLLTLKLLPIIEKKEESRIVTVTSGAQFFGKVGWKNLKAENYYNKWESYSNSKLANVMFALELNENLKHKNILSLAAHPGIAKTNLFTAQKPNPSPLEIFSLELFSPIFQTAEMGALPQLFAATSPDAKGGDHYGPRFNFRGHPKLSPTSPFAMNKKERKNLWEKSLEILSNFL